MKKSYSIFVLAGIMVVGVVVGLSLAFRDSGTEVPDAPVSALSSLDATSEHESSFVEETSEPVPGSSSTDETSDSDFGLEPKVTQLDQSALVFDASITQYDPVPLGNGAQLYSAYLEPNETLVNLVNELFPEKNEYPLDVYVYDVDATGIYMYRDDAGYFYNFEDLGLYVNLSIPLIDVVDGEAWALGDTYWVPLNIRVTNALTAAPILEAFEIYQPDLGYSNLHTVEEDYYTITMTRDFHEDELWIYNKRTDELTKESNVE